MQELKGIVAKWRKCGRRQVRELRIPAEWIRRDKGQRKGTTTGNL